ncbi:MAG: hypothetical protein M1339_04190 [Bacteroidetes bacterium]|nr:hypothetical protein [Bacteroidota bacterium]
MGILLALILILFAVFSRLIPHAPNFTPVISVALFAGAYLKKGYAFLVPVAALFLSDVVIGFYGLESMAFVYCTIILIAAMGLLLEKRVSAGKVLGLSLTGSVIFFITTNFGVWVVPGSIYPKTLAGLAECYTMAIPFFGNTLLSTLVYSAAMFGVYEAAEKFVLKAKTAQE